MSDIIVMKFPPYYTKNQINKINEVQPDILIFDDDFITGLKEFKFPDSIFYIDFGKKFNKSLSNIKLPRYLKKIKFGDNFVQSLDYVRLPQTLEIIELGKEYINSLFCVKLPICLKELVLNDVFNSGIPCVLPENLEKLVLGKNFDYSVNNFIVPQNLKILRISGTFTNKTLFDNLPKTLEYLEIVNYLGFDLDYELPLLKKLMISDNRTVLINFEKLPRLEQFICSGKAKNEQILNKLPNTIKYLEITQMLDINLVNLPLDLEELYINIDKQNSQVFNIFQININNAMQNNQSNKKELMYLQTNLPINLKKIRLSDSELIKYIEKISFDCIVTDSNDNPVNTNE
jgi:hypothetical protein